MRVVLFKGFYNNRGEGRDFLGKGKGGGGVFYKHKHGGTGFLYSASVSCKFSLLQIGAEEPFYPVERNLLQVVIQVRMHGAGHDELAGVGLLAMDEEDGAADFRG